MKRWLVRRHRYAGGGDVLEADDYEVLTGGVLRLYVGTIFANRTVRTYAPAAWQSIEPAPAPPTEESP